MNVCIPRSEKRTSGTDAVKFSRTTNASSKCTRTMSWANRINRRPRQATGALYLQFVASGISFSAAARQLVPDAAKEADRAEPASVGVTSQRRYGSLKICAAAQRAVIALSRPPGVKHSDSSSSVESFAAMGTDFGPGELHTHLTNDKLPGVLKMRLPPCVCSILR